MVNKKLGWNTIIANYTDLITRHLPPELRTEKSYLEEEEETLFRLNGSLISFINVYTFLRT